MSEQEDRSPLQPRGIFAELGPEEAEALLDAGEPVSFPAGEAVFEVGDRADAMYVILGGEAQVDVGGRFHVLRSGEADGHRPGRG
jgi:CRP-like cAMP-binding protein